VREKVAELRRSLPPGAVIEDYQLLDGPGSLDDGDAPTSTVRLSELFIAPGRSLVIYQVMFGKKQTKPCPMSHLERPRPDTEVSRRAR